MKTTSRTLLMALLGLLVSALSTAGYAADEETASQPQEQASAPVTEAPTESQPTQSTESTTASEPTAVEPAAAEPAAAEALEPTEYQLGPENKGADAEKTVEEPAKAPITGAFGITLGEKFAPYMVSKVLGQEDKTYKDRGEQKTEHTGTQYRVEPNVPNQYFNEYEVLTNKDGIIYSISGKQTPDKPVNSLRDTPNSLRSP